MLAVVLPWSASAPVAVLLAAVHIEPECGFTVGHVFPAAKVVSEGTDTACGIAVAGVIETERKSTVSGIATAAGIVKERRDTQRLNRERRCWWR